MGSEESTLVERARAGSRDAFGRLVVLHQHGIYGYVRRIIGDAESARDVAQEAFLRAYTSLAGLRDPRKFRPWLYAIAVNLSRNWLKRQRRAPLSLGRSPSGSPADERELPDPGLSASPSYVADRKELRSIVARAVEALPPKYRDVSILRLQHGLKVSEVAEALGVSVAAVESRLRRVKAMLREKLDGLD